MHLVKASFTAHELKCSLRTGVCELCDLVRRGCGQSVRSRSRWTQCCCSGVMGLVLSTFSYLETISGRSCSCFCPCENCLAYVTGWTVRMTTVISRASNSRFESILFDSLCESIRIYSFCKKNRPFDLLVSTDTFRSYGRQILQVNRPNQQRQALKEVLRHI